jgi:hypothetical protein
MFQIVLVEPSVYLFPAKPTICAFLSLAGWEVKQYFISEVPGGIFEVVAKTLTTGFAPAPRRKPLTPIGT